jgi:hypothetical protein
LLIRSDAALRAAGVVSQSRWVNGRMHHRYLVPLADGRMVKFESAVEPSIEVGAGRIAKKIKKGLKKVAKSKALGAVLKGISKLAKVVPIPGASALGEGLSYAAKAQKLAQQGKGIFKGKKKKPKALPAPAGKPAALARTQARSTAVKPVVPRPATRPLASTPGVMVKLDSGRRAIVTFVD